ncbi:helix-turn-helix domain-containing protein [Streptomyces sp. HU2014]|uniref:IclR family transcriptional regulator domain-containing protein n=1 Tax=Streptomyces sp. HU2014 TaxID=2939414 RepID=UPI00200D35E7|nr:IclR family transcriptional regulator C-terminal domain-containing protein [Streptomyces sp. HU2014]UQI47252.1 helix-turn-helix domain-containing protein [Streptomyces sp. HU2014]
MGPLVRGLVVLRALAGHEARTRVRPADLTRTTGLARSVVDRVLATLGHLGYVRADGREVVLAVGLMELGNAYLTASGVPAALGPHVERLAAALDASVSVAVPDAEGVRIVAQAARPRAASAGFRAGLRIGDLLPAGRCAPGALFAAAPPDWAVDDQLLEPGLVAVAVPVRDRAGRTACAVTVTSHTSRHSADGLREEALPALRAAVPAMEAALAAHAGSGESGDGAAWHGAEGSDAAPASYAAEGATSAPASRTAGSGPALHAPHGTEGSAPASYTADGGVPTPVPYGGKARSAAAYGEEDGPAAASGAEGAPGSVPSGPLADPGSSPVEATAPPLRSLVRGLAVLRGFGVAAAPGRGATLSELAAAAGLARATARRALLTLAHLGYVAADGGRFRPLPRVLELGHAPLGELTFAGLAVPHLRALVRRVGESASLAVLDGPDIRYVARVPTVRIMSVDITVGTRFPAHATSMGRVLLAGLDARARAAWLAGEAVTRAPTPRTVTSPTELAGLLDRVAGDGYALVDQELEEGLRSLAVPVRDARGRVVAALNVATHAGRGGAGDTRRDFLPALRETAARIEADVRTASAHRALGTG